MNITSDGNYRINQKNGRFSSGIVYTSGAFGAATVVLNNSVNDALTPLTSGALSTNAQYKVDHGQMADLIAVVSSSNGSTDFNIEYNGMS